MKITIYELLGLIKDGKAPMIIKYDNYIWRLRTEFNDYFNDDSYLFIRGFDEYENAKDFLDDEVEIIEEDKKIEKIPLPSFEEFKNMSAEERYLITAKEYDLLDELIEEIEKLKGKSE